MASPMRAGSGSENPRTPPLWKRPFVIETDIEVVQPAGQCRESCEVGRLLSSACGAAVEIVSTASCGPPRYPLPELFPSFAERMLELLRTPEVVKTSVRTFLPPDRAVTTAAIHVELLRDDRLSNPSTLRKLFADASTAACKREGERKRERERKKKRREEVSREEGTDVKELEKMESPFLLPELAQLVG